MRNLGWAVRLLGQRLLARRGMCTCWSQALSNLYWPGQYVSDTRWGSFAPQVKHPLYERGAQGPAYRYMQPGRTNGDCWPGRSTHSYHVLATDSVCLPDAAYIAWCLQFGCIMPGPGTYNLADSGPRRPGAGLKVNIGGGCGVRWDAGRQQLREQGATATSKGTLVWRCFGPCKRREHG